MKKNTQVAIPHNENASILNHQKSNPDDSKSEYDPYAYGAEGGLGFWGAVANHMKSLIGTGILVMPFVYKNLGYVTGTWLTLLIGLTYYHCIHILLSVEYRLCQRSRTPHMTLVGVTERIFADTSPIIAKIGIFFKIATYLYFGNPMSCSLCLTVATGNIKNIIEYFELEEIHRVYIITILFVPLMCLTMVEKLLKILVPFSTISNLFTLVMASIIALSSFVYGAGPASKSAKALGDPILIPQFFGAILLTVHNTGIVLPLKREMNEPRKFSTRTGVLNTSATTTVIFFTVFGLVNYLNYGEEVRENILLNLPTHNSFSFVILFLHTWVVGIFYVLAIYVRFHTIWAGNLESRMSTSAYAKIYQYGFKLGINTLAYIMAIIIPRLSLVASMAGTIGILIDIILLPLLEILYIASEKKTIREILIVFKNLIIIIVGVVVFCVSTYQCICKIIRFYA